MRLFTARKRLLTLLATAIAAVAAVGAIAYWTGGGSGSGSAAVGSGGTVTLHATVADGGAPGVSVPVGFTASNSGTSAVMVSTVHLTGVSADVGHASCNTSDFTMETVTESHSVAAGASEEALPTEGSLVYANTSENQDACKGATLTLSLSSE